jgi:uncharacterized protein
LGFYRQSKAGALVCLRVSPNAGQEAIEGLEERADGSAVLRVRVKAVPDKGKANAAVIALLAKALELPRSAIALVGGDTARLKTLDIAGDWDSLAARLAVLERGKEKGRW